MLNNRQNGTKKMTSPFFDANFEVVFHALKDNKTLVKLHMIVAFPESDLPEVRFICFYWFPESDLSVRAG